MIYPKFVLSGLFVIHFRLVVIAVFGGIRTSWVSTRVWKLTSGITLSQKYSKSQSHIESPEVYPTCTLETVVMRDQASSPTWMTMTLTWSRAVRIPRTTTTTKKITLKTKQTKQRLELRITMKIVKRHKIHTNIDIIMEKEQIYLK